MVSNGNRLEVCANSGEGTPGVCKLERLAAIQLKGEGASDARVALQVVPANAVHASTTPGIEGGIESYPQFGFDVIAQMELTAGNRGLRAGAALEIIVGGE